MAGWSRADVERLDVLQKQLVDLGQHVGASGAGIDTLIHANELLRAVSGMAIRSVELEEHKRDVHEFTEALRPLAHTEER